MSIKKFVKTLFERTRMVDSVDINLPQANGNYCLIQDDKT
jgi:hypothetical protein